MSLEATYLACHVLHNQEACYDMSKFIGGYSEMAEFPVGLDWFQTVHAAGRAHNASALHKQC